MPRTIHQVTLIFSLVTTVTAVAVMPVSAESIEAYLSTQSVEQGGSIDLHVSTNEPVYHISVY